MINFIALSITELFLGFFGLVAWLLVIMPIIITADFLKAFQAPTWARVTACVVVAVLSVTIIPHYYTFYSRNLQSAVSQGETRAYDDICRSGSGDEKATQMACERRDRK